VLRDDEVAADGDDTHHSEDDEPKLARAQRRVHGVPIGRQDGAGLPEMGDTPIKKAKREGAVSRALGSAGLANVTDRGPR
jgi:hypothetical protein